MAAICRGINMLGNFYSSYFNCIRWKVFWMTSVKPISLFTYRTFFQQNYISSYHKYHFSENMKLWVWCYDFEIRLLPEICKVTSKILHFYQSVYVLINCILIFGMLQDIIITIR